MGCVASIATPSVPALPADNDSGVHHPGQVTIPVEHKSFNDAHAENNASQGLRTEKLDAASMKYTPRQDKEEAKQGGRAAGTLLSMAMGAVDTSSEAEAVASPESTSRGNGASRFATADFRGEEDHPQDLPDIGYSIRGSTQGSDAVVPMDPSSPSSGAILNHAAVSRNVVGNRPSIHHLQPGAINAEFFDPRGGHSFVPLQAFTGPNAVNAVPFMPMHPLAPHGHPFHLAPLDQAGHLPIPVARGPSYREVGGRGRGRGVTAMAPGFPPSGFPLPGARSPPLVMGRGRGQPLQIVIPPGHSGRANPTSRVDLPQSGSSTQQAVGKSSTEDSDDDNDDLIDDGEEVEDWGLSADEVAAATPQQQPVAGSISREPPPSTAKDTSPPPKKLRPVAFQVVDGEDGITAVESDGDSSDDDDDGGNDGELEDWLDASPEPLPQLNHRAPLSPPKQSPPEQVVTPHSSPIKSSPSPLPTHRPFLGQAASPHPPLPLQPSLRQLGNISPTRPAGPPPASVSPVKPPSYRSNIVTNAVPIILPLLASTSSPTASPPTADASKGGAIRDTTVVKKKKAQLPQTNLPHPVPKFGDWLNSRTMINNYIILESLGAGSYAEVKLCKEKVTGKLFAMKFINRDLMKKDKLGKQSKLDDIKREIAIMKKLNHPNVLRLYEVMDDPSMNKLFLVLEYMKHGDLLSHQKKKHANDNQLHDRDLHCVLLQVLLGLAYLHEQKIVHGDIKPQNLLVGEKDVVKIADFGISQSLYGSKQKLSDTAGTPAFMSPEMCSGSEYSGQLADIWAVGATVFMLKFGRPPFVATSALQMFERIQSDPLVFPGPIDAMLEDLLRGMLTKNPIKRLTLLQIMTHPWVTKEEHPSHFVLKEQSPQITVTSEEIENAIDTTDKFAIIVNIRVQMMKRLQRARQQILKRKPPTTSTSDDSTHQRLEMALTEDNTVSKSGVMTSPGKLKSNKVCVDGPAGDATLSNEEIHYRSQLFSRKKASGVASANSASSAGFQKALDHESHHLATVASAFSVTDTTGNDDDDDDLDALLSDDEDDDEHAVSQSPQLLDELLLTTLSMPPLSKSVASVEDRAAEISCPLPNTTTPVMPIAPHSRVEPQDAQSFQAANTFLNISIAASSLQGRRNTQEDRWAILPEVDSALSSRWAKSLFAGIYDGHGGEECATILQEQLHAFLFRAPDQHFRSADKLQQCFLDFDAYICDYLLHKGDLSGSTATCVLVDHSTSVAAQCQWKLLVGHVGDCRLVLCKRNGEAVDLTSDHRLTLAPERDRILQLGGRVVNNRVNGVMAITRAFGDLEFKGLMDKHHGNSSMSLIPDAVQLNPFQRDDEHTPALLTARPDIQFLSIDGATDEFLLLACDGLWDVMTSEEASEILRDRFHLHGNLQLAAKELAQEGIRRYSNDNITVLVLHFPPPTS